MLEGKDEARDPRVGTADHRCRPAARRSVSGERGQPAMVKLSVNVNKVATRAQFARWSDSVRACRPSTSVCAPARPASPSIRARMPGTSRQRTRARSARSWRRGRSAPSSTSRAIRVRICSSLVHEVRPTQCTLVPVQAGRDHQPGRLGRGRARPRDRRRFAGFARDGIRVSLFVDPDERSIRWAAAVGADRVELYTEPFARAFERGDGTASFRRLFTCGAVWPTSSVLASMPATTWIWSNLVLFRPAAAPRRGLDRPCAGQPCAVRRARAQRPRVPAASLPDLTAGGVEDC